MTLLWWIDVDEHLGRISIWHRLIGDLVDTGHVGYDVRPSARRRERCQQADFDPRAGVRSGMPARSDHVILAGAFAALPAGRWLRIVMRQPGRPAGWSTWVISSVTWPSRIGSDILSR